MAAEFAKKLPFMTAPEISGLVAAREVSAREVAEAALARVAAIDGAVHAYNEVTPELALAAADALDGRIAAGATAAELGPLVGVPVAIKDNMNLIGTHTTCSSRLLEDFQSPYDCTAVRRLLDAGTLPLGKLNMDEFAFGSSTETSVTGPTRNPWDLERTPGGSSGGSAAAVAAGLATITLGSDTGGSIRQPGAFTGTVALKPTYGRVSRYGCVAFASSLDQIGPLAHSVTDVALALGAIAGKDRFDATSFDVPVDDYSAACGAVAGAGLNSAEAAANAAENAAGLRVAVATDLLDMEGLDPRLRQEVIASAEVLEKLGAEIVEVSLPSTKYGLPAYYILGPAEASSNLARFDGLRYGRRAENADDMLDLYMRSRAEGFGPETIRRIMIGTYVLSAGYYDAYYAQAQKVRTLIKADYSAVFDKADVLLTPASPGLSFKLGTYDEDPIAMYLSDYYTISVNLAGLAGMSLPTSLIDGLPASVQIIANHFRECDLFRAASALESQLSFPYQEVPLKP